MVLQNPSPGSTGIFKLSSHRFKNSFLAVTLPITFTWFCNPILPRLRKVQALSRGRVLGGIPPGLAAVYPQRAQSPLSY